MPTTDEITEAHLAALESQPDETLAEWWCELNRGQWPKGLTGTLTEDERVQESRAFKIMFWIDAKIGRKLILRTWNKDMPNDVFESFWRKERDAGTPYGDWSKKRINERMARYEERQAAILSSDVVLDDVLDAEFLEA